MNVTVKQIDFSTREVVKDNASSSSTESTDSYNKSYWLVLHVSFDYDSLLGERRSGTATKEQIKIAEINYDSKGNCDEMTEVGKLPSLEEIKKVAQDLAESKAKSLLNEEKFHSYVNNFEDQVKAYDVPREGSPTGLKEATSLSDDLAALYPLGLH